MNFNLNMRYMNYICMLEMSYLNPNRVYVALVIFESSISGNIF